MTTRGTGWWHQWYVDLARHISTASKDPSTKVGAVIVSPDNRVMSVGFNGFPRCMEDKAEWYEDRTEKYSRIVHGEVNALLFARESVNRCTLYTYPLLSCDRCAVQMLQAGINRFVAPKPSDTALERWGDALERTRQYVREAGGMVIEL